MIARRLSARWVLPVDEPAIEHGAVLLGRDGRIMAVGPERLVPAPDGVPAEDFGDALILPGLINTHTHLELTGLASGPLEPDFAAWIGGIRAAKASRSPDAFQAAARRGLADCWAAGVTTIADTGDSGAVLEALAESHASGIAYHEVFGPHPEQRDDSLRELQSQVERLGKCAGGRVRLGVSPHAPYTVSGKLYEAVASWARAAGLPVAVHLAESPAESSLLASGTGPFADAWRARGIPLPAPPGHTPVRWLEAHGVLTENTLCIHVVQADGADIRRLATAGVAVAHCPLSNRAHGHGAAPLPALLAAGLRVGLGTDSVASVGTLDLIAEARAARVLAGLDAGRALRLCTLDGARALGLEGETGSLTTGKWGDIVVIRSAAEGVAPTRMTPEERVMASAPRDVLATFVGGRDVHRSSPTP
ncbi:MAG TPA: amidohydrolase family protein [Gemmatimonadales bacterium]|nr:amidohydrolase family protein [Gemmatimonadales bacterium]